MSLSTGSIRLLSSRAQQYVGLGPDSNKRARQTTSTPTTAPARLALRSNVLSGLAEKFAETGLLVSSNAKPTAWPDLILSGLILYGLILYAACLAVACQVMACLVPGLCACHGLFRFSGSVRGLSVPGLGLILSGLVLSCGSVCLNWSNLDW